MFMSYGKAIRFLRVQAKMSQGDLARKVGGGITNQSVSGWEREKARPSTENLFELARIFGVSANEIMGGDQPVPSGSIDPTSSMIFVALEETLLQAGIGRNEATEIAATVELALKNLRVPQAMTAAGALRRIIRWEVRGILERKQA
jgi:transcriptional regulator with XRE-family HTH domain